MVEQARDNLLARQDVGDLLLALGPFLARLREDATVADALDDIRREALAAHQRFVKHDAAMVAKLRALRVEVPEDAVADGTGPGSLEGSNLPTFDGMVVAKSELHEAPNDRKDHSKAAMLIACLRERLYRVPEPLQGVLRARLQAITEEHERTFRDFSIALRNEPGFALNRLDLGVRQSSPKASAGTPEHYDEHYTRALGNPMVLRALVDGKDPQSGDRFGTHEAAAIESSLREDVPGLCSEVLRRLGAIRSREAILRSYKLRCEWYDRLAICRLVAALKGKQAKEDQLADHLALFLFDSGLRPLTRAMVGRVVPDAFEPFPPGTQSFYVEAKQYADRAGARKAVREGPRQIWSTGERIRSRYDLHEAFLVVFRLDGPLLRFEGPATARDLTVRPILIDLAPGTVSGSRQKEIIDVSVADLLASAKQPLFGPPRSPRSRPRRRRRLP